MEETLTVHDFPSICRICTTKGDLKPFTRQELLDLFKNITAIELDFETLPQNVCSLCTNTLETILEFINKSKSSDVCLREIYEKSKFEVEQDEAEDFLDDTALDPDWESEDEKDKKIIIKDVDITDEVKEEDFSDTSVKSETRPRKRRRKITRQKSDSAVKVSRRPVQCNVCNVTFNRRKEYNKHKMENPECNQTKEYECDTCGMKFPYRYKMETHMKSHNEDTPYECKVCGKKFKFQHNVRRHDKIAHKGLKPFKCDICGKDFARLEAKRNHDKVHDVKPYRCKICGKVLSKLFQYRKHLKIHIVSDNKIKLCVKCGEEFKTEEEYLEHEKMHLEKKDVNQVQCEICNQVFLAKTLQSHMLIHAGKKEHLCHICGRTFLKKAYLELHASIHTGEMKYNCETCGRRYCGKAFAQKTNMEAHERTHTGEMRHLCQECGKTFADSSGLRKHQKGHQPPKSPKVKVEVIEQLLGVMSTEFSLGN
nr:unnamed protein product [Callosobruchus chinensis]